MRICVLGHRGMLGHVVVRYLNEQGYDVAVVQERFHAKNSDPFISEIFSKDAQWCINCIGVKPSPSVTRNQLFEINALLPQVCAEKLRGKITFLHASTDGVFRPDRENRSLSEQTDATDDYGLSKRQAEQAVINSGGTVIRCSVIGPEVGEPRSLLGWLLCQSEVNGYLNHSWNGITTLEWAKVFHELIKRQPGTEESILQPGTLSPMSKCEVLQLIARVWNLKVKIRAIDAKESVTRTLVPTLLRPNLDQQLEQLKAWY